MGFAENFSNFGRTKLAGAIAGTGTGTFTVATGDGAKFPATNFYVAIDNEVIWCASRAGDVFTMTTRGDKGTTAATHSLGANVLHGALAHHLLGVATLAGGNAFAGLQQFTAVGDYFSTLLFAAQGGAPIHVGWGPGGFHIGWGAEFVSGTGWTARAAAATIIQWTPTGIVVYYNSGLTTGNAFTPTQVTKADNNGVDASVGKVREGGNPLIPVASIIQSASVAAPAGWLMCDGSAVSRTTYAALFAAITITQNATTTAGSATLTGLADTSNMKIGMRITGANLPAGVTIASIVSGTSITISTGTGVLVGAAVPVIVYPFGPGDASTTFNLPDFRGRSPMGAGTGTGGGATGYGAPTGGVALAARAVGQWVGAETQALVTANMPSHSHGGATSTESVSHTHSGTSATQSADHSHSFSTGTVSADHSHSVSGETAGHTHLYWTNSANAVFTTGSGTGMDAGANANSGGDSNDHAHTTAGSSANHTHSGTTAGMSVSHTHTITTGNASAAHTHTITAEGSGTGLAIVEPSLVVNYLIKT